MAMERMEGFVGMNRLLLNGHEQEIDISFDVNIVGTGAKETINVGEDTSIMFTAGDDDQVNLPHNLADYTITSEGVRVFLVDHHGNRIALSVNGNSTVGFADGTATLGMVFPPGQMPRIELGGARVGEMPLSHDEVDLDKSSPDDGIDEAVLSILDIHVEPESPVAGETFFVDVDLAETANVETENLSVQVAIGDQIVETIDIDSDVLSDIKDDIAIVRFDGLEITEPGDYTVTATVSADNAEAITAAHDFTVMPQMPDALAITIDNIAAGKVGFGVTVDANVFHFGQAETVSLTLQQDDMELSESVPLQMNDPGGEAITFTFEDTSVFEPGMVEARLSVEEGGVFAEDALDFGLYDADGDYTWQWADPARTPFNMIGHVVVDREEGGGHQYVLGTGFLISPGHIMTNAHVLESGWEGDLSALNSVDFFLGRNGGNLFENQEENHYRGESAHLQKSEWLDRWPDTDMAIISLDQDIEAYNGQAYFDWFWNARDAVDRDLSGQTLYLSGYPSGGVDQGKDEIGNGLYFQWMAQGAFDGYLPGYEDYGGASGGLRLSQKMAGAPGASGSPVFWADDDGQYLYAGTFTGSKNGHPVAANLDPAAYDWALTIAQADGYLLDMDFLDGPLDVAALGPATDLDGSSGDAAPAFEAFDTFDLANAESSDIQVHGVADMAWAGMDAAA